MKYLCAILSYLVVSLAAIAVQAAVISADQGESYAQPTFKELSQTMVMMDGMDVTQPVLTDEYAKLMYCDLYKQNHKNDFDWNKIRQMILSRAVAKKDYYRIQFEVGGTVFLGTYNFETQDFPFVRDSALTRVGSMILLERSRQNPTAGGAAPLCGDTDFSPYFPFNYILIMNQPFTFDRLKIPMDEAKILLDKMAAAKNMDRRLFVRFRFRVQAVDKLPPAEKLDLRKTRVQMHGELTQADVFLDADMTKYLTSVPLKQ